MIELTSEPQTPTGTSMADVFAQALAETPESVVTDDAPASMPAPSAPPLPAPASPAAATAAAPALAPPEAPPVTPEASNDLPPTPTPSPSEPVELPVVMRQVQELTGLLAQGTPEAADAFLGTLAEVNEPLALQLVQSLKKHLDGQEQGRASLPVELPPVTFDFGSRSQEDYDEQTWGDFQAAKTDIDTARNTATYWQQRAIQAEQSLAEQTSAQQARPSADFINARAQTIMDALSAVPTLQGNEQAYKIVHGSLLNELQSLPSFIEGMRAAKDGNQLGAYQAGLLVDQAINEYVATAAKTLVPAASPAPAAPAAAPPASPAPPVVGAPALHTAIPPATPAPGASFVDGLLAQLQTLEQANAMPWGQ